MGQDINIVTIIGRLGKDIEIKYSSSGFAIGNMSIANTRSSKKGDAWIEETNWFNACLFGSQAERLSPYLLRGQQVCLNGSLKYEQWEKDGVKQSRVLILVSSIQLIGSKKEGGMEVGTSQQRPDQRKAIKENPASYTGNGFDEDIPF